MKNTLLLIAHFGLQISLPLRHFHEDGSCKAAASSEWMLLVGFDDPLVFQREYLDLLLSRILCACRCAQVLHVLLVFFPKSVEIAHYYVLYHFLFAREVSTAPSCDPEQVSKGGSSCLKHKTT